LKTRTSLNKKRPGRTWKQDWDNRTVGHWSHYCCITSDFEIKIASVCGTAHALLTQHMWKHFSACGSCTGYAPQHSTHTHCKRSMCETGVTLEIVTNYKCGICCDT